MILYFSGTGNSEYVAKRIANEIQDEVINLFTKIKKEDYSAISSSRPWVIVTPTYAWQIPKIITKWLERTKLLGNQHIYFVMTCGGSIGNASASLTKLCNKTAMIYQGCSGILMPENYIALYETPDKETSLKIISNAEIEIDKVADIIHSNLCFPANLVNMQDKLESGIVNTVFYKFIVNAKAFRVNNQCISCGICKAVCPLNNIAIIQGKPEWRNHCTHCMACISHCPKEAIEYGKHSKERNQYVCPKHVK